MPATIRAGTLAARACVRYCEALGGPTGIQVAYWMFRMDLLRLASDVRGLRIVVFASVALLLASCDSGTEPGREDEEETTIIGQVAVTINTDEDRSPISPFIYGSNQDRPSDLWTVRRYGGNRLTAYNWENNFSNAGSDWQHSSDRFLLSSANLGPLEASVPARVITHFHDQSLTMGAKSIVTLQMAGYAAADDAGPVPPSETAPSPRWVEVRPRKGTAFATSPDLNDGAVYMDELVHLLVSRYGDAASQRGVRWYSLDNEPALWSHTHPRIQPQPASAAEVVERSIALASAVKDVDPNAQILGPALYGMAAYMSLQDAPDWNAVRGGYDWFIDYYLDQMRQAEQRTGRRLLDVLDVHWYPEARGDNRITDNTATTDRDITARLQAPRTLWDPTYSESSWIGDWLGDYLPILPRLRQSIERYYPSTRLAITEYNYGGGNSISGGLAQADVLGAFGKYGVHIAALWGITPGDSYVSAAFKLYRNFDGQQSSFGETSVRATTSDAARTSVYAAITSEDASGLHVILLNKERTGALDVRLQIEGTRTYSTGEAWAFNATSAQITQRKRITSISGKTFQYVLPELTAVHLVLR